MTHLQDNEQQALVDAEAFRRDLTALIPKMRAYARSMCGRNASEGDDLAQEALLKAWTGRKSFTPGTNLKAWVFMILRNQFYSDKRRSWRQQQLDQDTAEATLVAIDDPMSTLELDELRRAIAKLPDEQREALILIGAGGFSYEEVAEMCGAAAGTIKSRVSRARDRLALILAEGSYGDDQIRPSAAMGDILAQLSHLTPARLAA